jgi:poly(A) polymerase Pap1
VNSVVDAFSQSNDRSGTVESRIRQLVMKLEYVDSLTLAHPFVRGFDQVSYCLNEEEVHSVAQGEVSEAVMARRKEDIEGKDGAYGVYTTTFYIGLLIEPKQGMSCLYVAGRCDRCGEAGSTGPRRLDISYPTAEFTKLVKMWEKYDDATMGIVVRHIKRFGRLVFLSIDLMIMFLKAQAYLIMYSKLASVLQRALRNVPKCVSPFLLITNC